MFSLLDRYPKRIFEHLKYGANFITLSKGDIGVLAMKDENEIKNQLLIEQIVHLPKSLQKGDILEVRNFLVNVLRLPDASFELACCGQELPKEQLPLDFFTIGYQPILLVKNLGYFKEEKIKRKGSFTIQVQSTELQSDIPSTFELKFFGKVPREVTFQTITERLSKKLNMITDKIFLKYDLEWMKCGLTLGDYDVWDNCILELNIFDQTPFTVYVKTLTGKTIPVVVRSSTTTLELNEMIQEKESIPLGQQRLFYGGSQLEGLKIMDYYNITLDSTFHLVLRLSGGGNPNAKSFADLSGGKTERLKWSTSAPKWRYTDKGLCIEGSCFNANCQAYNKMVIIQMGIGSFDLVMDEHQCKCPLCKEYVKPITAAFNNCQYRWTGIKSGEKPGDPPITCKEENFITVRDEYLRFDESDKKKGGNGMSKWLRLVIHTIPIDAKKATILEKPGDEIDAFRCPITQEMMKNPVMASDGHSYEENAIRAWYDQELTSPMTREALQPNFTRNHALRNAIQFYLSIRKSQEKDGDN